MDKLVKLIDAQIFDIAEYLLEKQPVELPYDLFARNEHKQTVLMLAAKYNQPVLLQLILKRCPKERLVELLNAQDENKRSALFFAVSAGNIANIKFLLAAGIDVNLRRIGGNTVLFDAVKQPEVFRELLAVKNIDVNLRNNNGVTVLMWAAKYGCVETVRMLLDFAVTDLGAVDHNGHNVLSYCRSSLDKELIDLLLLFTEAEKIDLYNYDNGCRYGKSVLGKACFCGNNYLVQKILRRPDLIKDDVYYIDAIQKALISGHYYTASLLLEASKLNMSRLMVKDGINVMSYVFEQGSDYGKGRITEVLMARPEFNPNAVCAGDKKGLPFMLMFQHCHDKAVLRRLCGFCNIDPAYRDTKGRDYLQSARGFNNRDAVEVLTETA